MRVAGIQAFPCVTIAMKEPKATVQVFASGKMNCTGAKSEGDAKLAAKKVCWTARHD